MPKLSFGFRLALAGLITLTVVLFATQLLVSASVRETMLEENRLLYQADASFIQSSLAAGESGTGVPATTRAALVAIDERPAVVNVELVSTDGRVVAASPSHDVGQTERGRSVDVPAAVTTTRDLNSKPATSSRNTPT
ncbi:MAG: hypothetical protein M3P40_08650 [Actinomycetota bacterium]|nr:hypothetical protein [Actinomycetota bacterium]